MSSQKRRMFVGDWVTLFAMIAMMGFLIVYFIIKSTDKAIMDDLIVGFVSFLTVFVVLGIVTGLIYLVKWLTDREAKPMEAKKIEVDDTELIAVITAAVASSMGKARSAKPEFVVREYKSLNQ
ncbi:MAG: OadG family protein [Caldiserica bacterium]|nr:OadG family protein [Caldisericota bacterium]